METLVLNRQMKFEEAKALLIRSWGTLGSSWGINKTMAQIHALLLVSPEPLSTEDVMEEINISRGNANMNLRALIDWGLVRKHIKPGERKEYFYSEKDVWEVAKQVARERRKRELQPVVKILEEVQNIEGEKTAASKEFMRMTKELKKYVEKSDAMLDKMTRIDQSLFFKLLLKLP